MCKEILILYCLLFHTEIYMFYLLKCDNVRLSIILYFLFALKTQISYLTHYKKKQLTCPCNVDTFTSHFYIVKSEHTEVCIFSQILALRITCPYSLEPPQSNEAALTCTHNIFFSKNKKIIKEFQQISKKTIFTALKSLNIALACLRNDICNAVSCY